MRSCFLIPQISPISQISKSFFILVFSICSNNCENKEASARIEQARAETAKAIAEAAKAESIAISEIARAEQAKAEIAKAEAAKAEATAIAETARAETARTEAEAMVSALARSKEARAAAAETSQLNAEKLKAEKIEKSNISESLRYLNGENVSLELCWDEIKPSYKNSYKESHLCKTFKYDDSAKSLIFCEFKFNSSKIGDFPKSAWGSSSEQHIDLSTSNGVVIIMDYKPPGQRHPSKGPKTVSFKARMKSRNINIKRAGDHILDGYILGIYSNETKEALKKAPWENYEDRLVDVRFTVNEDVAPRLKNALEGIMKSIGVNVSKY